MGGLFPVMVLDLVISQLHLQKMLDKVLPGWLLNCSKASDSRIHGRISGVISRVLWQELVCLTLDTAGHLFAGMSRWLGCWPGLVLGVWLPPTGPFCGTSYHPKGRSEIT